MKQQEDSTAVELEELRQQLPDPFNYDSGLEAFYRTEKARALIDGGAASAQRLLQYIAISNEPALVRVAVLLLSRMDPALYYPQLLAELRRQPQAMIEAFDAGFWRMRQPEQKLARDIVDTVVSSGNASPLLLLQRPAAAQAVRTDLLRFAGEKREPFARYAMFALGNVLVAEDVPFYIEQVERADTPAIKALAGLYLLRLGSRAGLSGIEAGLTAQDVQLRTSTYQDLLTLLPEGTHHRIRFEPAAAPSTQQMEVAALLDAIRAH